VWESLDNDIASYKRRTYWDSIWSCGVRKKDIGKGDRAFLIRLGKTPPVGIMASGWLLGSPYEDTHFSDPQKTALYVNLRFDMMLHPFDDEILLRSELEKQIPLVHWTPEAGGTKIPNREAAELETLWTNHLTKCGFSPIRFPEEISAPERYPEGAIRQIAINAYERDPRARKACINHFGCRCTVCGFDFAKIYGEIGKDFIHVHHLKLLSEVGETYVVDPISDLKPVCPNCHAMLHKKKPPYSPQDLKSKMR